MNNNRFQFSKIIILLCMTILLIGTLIVLIISAVKDWDSTVPITAITATDAVIATIIAFYLKKSQAENTIKLMVGAYKQIAKVKKEIEGAEAASEFIDDVSNSLINKMDSNINTHLDNAIEMIETPDIK